MMKRSFLFAATVAVCALLGSGCYSVKPLDRPDQLDLSGEGTVVFSRAGQYTMWFGSHSPRECFEVVFERFSRNSAGCPVVEVGIRYRGGVSWTDWFKAVPQTATLSAQCNFYRSAAAQAEGPIAYSTNRERIVLQRGNTCAYRAVCPIRDAEGYQLVLGE